MAKVGTMQWTGASGREYPFDIYEIGSRFQAVGAVYIFSKVAPGGEGGGHTPIGVGQTESLAERFDRHHLNTCAMEHGANRICVHPEEDDDARLAIERDLRLKWRAPCNG